VTSEPEAAAGRVIYAALHLLDRQLVDGHGRFCGKVDDVELEESLDSGVLYVSALWTGAGALSRRRGARRLWRFLERAHARLSSGSGQPGRIPLSRVREIGDEIEITGDGEDLAPGATQRWVREHVIGRIPGSRVGQTTEEHEGEPAST
jgi:sporulation protein YlmC with PRC-barrel domain